MDELLYFAALIFGAAVVAILEYVHARKHSDHEVRLALLEHFATNIEIPEVPNDLAARLSAIEGTVADINARTISQPRRRTK